MRPDHRAADKLRPVKLTPGYVEYAEDSVLIEMGMTRVLCAVSAENQVPKWLFGQNQGWLTAEYAMLPRATHTRTPRETTPGARSEEIRRLIGRSACGGGFEIDWGTRTAAITGACSAIYLIRKHPSA